MAGVVGTDPGLGRARPALRLRRTKPGEYCPGHLTQRRSLRLGDIKLITWRTLLAASDVLFAATTGGIAGAAVSSCKLVKLEDWPIRVQRNLLLVDGAINGQKISVILDTGAP